MLSEKRPLFDDQLQPMSTSPILSSNFKMAPQKETLSENTAGGSSAGSGHNVNSNNATHANSPQPNSNRANTIPVVLVLTSKCVFYYLPESRQERKGFRISFDTIFQILRPKCQPDNKSLGIPFGIKFISNQFIESQEFYSDNVKDLDKWELQLRNVMNQFNFHDLFKAQKRLGKGNFATVYLGVQLKDQKKVAIKAFGRCMTFSQDNGKEMAYIFRYVSIQFQGKEAIINEIKITKMFNHPNLMKMQGVYQSQNSIYFALEYIEGNPICSRFNSLSKYSQSQRKFIMKGTLLLNEHRNPARARRARKEKCDPQGLEAGQYHPCEIAYHHRLWTGHSRR